MGYWLDIGFAIHAREERLFHLYLCLGLFSEQT
jgi:hypothetical protein